MGRLPGWGPALPKNCLEFPDVPGGILAKKVRCEIICKSHLPATETPRLCHLCVPHDPKTIVERFEVNDAVAPDPELLSSAGEVRALGSGIEDVGVGLEQSRTATKEVYCAWNLFGSRLQGQFAAVAPAGDAGSSRPGIFLNMRRTLPNWPSEVALFLHQCVGDLLYLMYNVIQDRFVFDPGLQIDGNIGFAERFF